MLPAEEDRPPTEVGPGAPTVDVLGLIRGYRVAALLHAVAALGVADALTAGPRDAQDLGRAVGADPGALARVLRALVAHGVFAERDGRFALNDAAHRLRRDVAGSLHPDALLAGAEHMPAWVALPDALRHGGVAFERVFGTSVWEHRRLHPELGAAFDAFTARGAGGIGGAGPGALVKALDLRPGARVVDVGGGVGALLVALLGAAPEVRGTVFDQAHVVAAAREVIARSDVVDRCDAIAGDFFASVPDGADLYLLVHVLHDWDDARAATILGACARAMTAPGARLAAIEHVLPDAGPASPEVHLLDVHMLAVDGGRERTRAEYDALMTGAGLELVRLAPLAGSVALIEARLRPGRVRT